MQSSKLSRLPPPLPPPPKARSDPAATNLHEALGGEEEEEAVEGSIYRLERLAHSLLEVSSLLGGRKLWPSVGPTS